MSDKNATPETVEYLRRRIQELELELEKYRDRTPTESSTHTSLMRHSMLYILTTDKDGYIKTISNAFLNVFQNHTHDSLIGHYLFSLLPFSTPELHKKLIALLNSNERYDFEYAYSTNTQELMTLKFQARALSQKKNIIGIIIVAEDITEQRKTEKTLLQKQAEYETTFQELPSAVIITNINRVIHYANPAAFKLFGYAPHEIIDQTTQHLYAKQEDYERFAELHQQVKVDNVATHGEIIFRHQDGTHIICESIDAPVRDIEGNLIGFIGIYTDVTENRRLATALRTNRERLNDTLNNLNDIVWSADINTLQLLYINQAPRYIHGRDETKYKDITKDSVSVIVHPDDLDDAWRAIQYAIDLGVYRHEYRIIHADGNIRWLLERMRIIYDDAGRAIRLDGVSTDITSRKIAELKLRESHNQLAASRDALQRLIRQLPVGIQVFDTNGICIDVNQKHLDIFGVTDAKELVGKYNILDDRLAHQVGTQQAASQALKGESIHLGDLEFDFTLGTNLFAQKSLGQRIINVTFIPIFDNEKTVSAVVGLNQDVTEQRTASQQQLDYAIQAERLEILEDLINDISHDLKTPITIIGTSLYLLRKSIQEPSNKYILKIEEQMSRLTKVIQEMLTMSRLSAIKKLDIERIILFPFCVEPLIIVVLILPNMSKNLLRLCPKKLCMLMHR